MTYAVIVAGAVGLLVLINSVGDTDRRTTADWQSVAPPPSVAAPLQPGPPSAPATGVSAPATGVSASAGRPSEVRTTPASESPPARQPPAPTKPSRTVPPAPGPDLTIGATIGLEVEGKPGLRVRHHDFAARVDQLSSTSSASDRAESRFIVRKGLAFGDCVSFEAVQHPGYYLRRFFSDLLLHERSDSTIYKQETTFCPIPTRDDKALSLLVLFPSNFTVSTAEDGRLILDSPDKAAPTRFVVRRPL